MKCKPTSPGKILNEEFLKPLRITPAQLAKKIGIEEQLIHEIIHERRNVTPEMADKFASFFGTSQEFWLNAERSFSHL